MLLSSHLLPEIQQVCDTVTILAKGRVVASGPVTDVLAGSSSAAVRVRVPDAGIAAAVLAAAGFTVTRRGARRPDPPRARRPGPGEITRVLAGQGTYLEELTPMTADLESAFLAITGDRA